jgi:hypothetical protein
VDRLLREVGAAYERGIAPGKEIHFLILTAFVVAFGLVRANTHLIRAQVSWWPGNLETKGGLHVHHLVWGILLLIVFGYVGMAFALPSPWREVVAVVFGVGMALTLDEFALWLNLEDVYWSARGRESIDAVIIAGALLAITLLGIGFWLDLLRTVLLFLGGGDRRLAQQESAAVIACLQLVGLALASVCLLKGKLLSAAVGLFVPLVALVGAVRLAKPGSRWARRYGPAKRDRSQARFGTAG